MIFLKPFGVLILVCQLPKETALSTWSTFTMSPIPPRSITHVAVFSTESEREIFEYFALHISLNVCHNHPISPSYHEKHYG